MVYGGNTEEALSREQERTGNISDPLSKRPILGATGDEIWSIFSFLNRQRPQGMGLYPLSVSDMSVILDAKNITDKETYIALIAAIDVEFVRWCKDNQPKK